MFKGRWWLAGGLFCGLVARPQAAAPPGQTGGAPPVPASPGSALSQSLVERQRANVARIQALVDEGTLPKSLLEEAQQHLADLEDQEILSGTLYGQIRLEDLSDEQASRMVAAAQRRVDRQTALVVERHKLLDTGILSRYEFAQFEQELDSRRRVLGLAQNRQQLLEQLRQMAASEQQLQRQAQASEAKNVMIRYDGNRAFNLGDMTTISSQFERRFHHPLPVSALGQTAVHRLMGLDHRNRVDVALNPDQQEGLWLRNLLERLHIPYLAFRSAVAGAATAPHIHIGLGSTRLASAVNSFRPGR